MLNLKEIARHLEMNSNEDIWLYIVRITRQFFSSLKPDLVISNPIKKSYLLSCMMPSNRVTYFVIFSAVTLSLLSNSITVISPAMASKKGGGSVVQLQASTGNSGLDKEINKFYSCISKTHQDPPTIEKVDNCYYQTIGGGTNGGASGSSSTNAGGASSTATKHHHKH